MITEVKTDEYGRIYIPLPDETREAITLEFLKEDYKTLMHCHKHTAERLCEQPGLWAAQQDYEDESRFKKAFETLIEYYGGTINE